MYVTHLDRATYNNPDIQNVLAQMSSLAGEGHFINNILYCFTQTAEISAICQKKVSRSKYFINRT